MRPFFAMTITLPKEVLDTLPQADTKGVVRVVVAMRVGDDGEASLAEVNDVPVGGAEEEEEAPEIEPEEPMPTADEIDASLLGM